MLITRFRIKMSGFGCIFDSVFHVLCSISVAEMSEDSEGGSGTKAFDIYLHCNEEMRAIKDVNSLEYSYQQLITDAHVLALSQFPTCSMESVFVSYERMVRGRRCKSPLSCDYGLKRLFSSNQNAYVFFVKCYDGLPSLGLMEKVKRYSKMDAEEEVDHSSDSDEEWVADTRKATRKPRDKCGKYGKLGNNVNGCPLGWSCRQRNPKGIDQRIKQASKSMVENVPLASTFEAAGERTIVSSNQLGEESNHASVTQVYARKRKTATQVYVRKRKMVSSSQLAILHCQGMAERVNFWSCWTKESTMLL